VVAVLVTFKPNSTLNAEIQKKLLGKSKTFISTHNLSEITPEKYHAIGLK